MTVFSLPTESTFTYSYFITTGVCTDLDGGFYPDNYGAVFLNWTYYSVDVCFDGANLWERICINNTPSEVFYHCADGGYAGCTNGACTATTTTSTTSTTTTTEGGGGGHHTTTTTTTSTTTTTGICYDTDGGNWSDYYGILHYNGTIIGDDVCTDNATIVERYCNSSNEPATDTYLCSVDGFDICQWGMCLYFGETTSTTTTTTTTSTTTTSLFNGTTWNITEWNLPDQDAPIDGTCPNGSVPSILMLFFIFGLILGAVTLNELALHLPILNVVIGAGVIVFGFTLFPCAWFLAFICWLFGIGLAAMAFFET